MAFLDVKMQQGPQKFDWDNFKVGNHLLDDSQNFFVEKHYDHERVDEMEYLRQEMLKTELTESPDRTEVLSENKENKDLSLILSPNCKKEAQEKTPTSPDDVIKNSLERQGVQKKVAPNLACEWSTKKVIRTAVAPCKGAISKVMPPPPNAYLAKDIYQKKREEAERRRAEEERRKREFHSRPVPKFDVHHEQLQKLKPVHVVTVAVTPQVLKKSREAEEKRRKKLEEWKLKNHPPQFESRPPTVLKEKPFVPEKKPTVLKQCPFKLHVEKRLQERKCYDELKHKALEEKQKQVKL
ncbi:hypothetical protein DOY81_012576 [Sarcophaga bullata]|nr:hypothetical protein DOY81_012576 [Sarcophaga bullata]